MGIERRLMASPIVYRNHERMHFDLVSQRWKSWSTVIADVEEGETLLLLIIWRVGESSRQLVFVLRGARRACGHSLSGLHIQTQVVRFVKDVRGEIASCVQTMLPLCYAVLRCATLCYAVLYPLKPSPLSIAAHRVAYMETEKKELLPRNVLRAAYNFGGT